MDIQCFHSVTRIDALCSNLQKYLYLLLSLFAKLSFVQMTIICQYRADFDENWSHNINLKKKMFNFPKSDMKTHSALVLHKRTAMVMMAVDLAIGVWWCGVQKSVFISERNNPKTFWSKPLFHDLCAKNATKMPHLQEIYSYIMQLRATQAMHTAHATNEHT